MTAYLVLLAQTRVGFLSGGRGKSFRKLPAQEQAAQKEEAYARATVALTRAQQICFIMGPLDMCGLVGAATIIGCLKYGACFSGQNEQDDPVFLIRLKDEELVEAPDDSAFLQSLRHSCARVNGVYPPMSLIEPSCSGYGGQPGHPWWPPQTCPLSSPRPPQYPYWHGDS